MTLDRDKQLLRVQAGFGGFCNVNPARLSLFDVQRERRQPVVDECNMEVGLDRVFAFEPGTRCGGGLATGRTQ